MNSPSLFWIVGGEYQNFAFTDLIPGTGRVVGPFAEKIEAERAWRLFSETHRAQCLMRFTIATEAGAQAIPNSGSRVQHGP
jgi:hypothetical protein